MLYLEVCIFLGHVMISESVCVIPTITSVEVIGCHWYDCYNNKELSAM